MCRLVCMRAFGWACRGGGWNISEIQCSLFAILRRSWLPLFCLRAPLMRSSKRPLASAHIIKRNAFSERSPSLAILSKFLSSLKETICSSFAGVGKADCNACWSSSLCGPVSLFIGLYGLLLHAGLPAASPYIHLYTSDG